MKCIKIFVILFITTLVLTGCAEDDDVIITAEGEIFMSMSKVELLIEINPNEIDIDEIPNFVTATITNLSDETAWGGWVHEVERHNGIWWGKIRRSSGAVNAVGVQLEPGQSYDLRVGLRNETDSKWGLGENPKAGTYRVVYHGHYREFTIS